MCHYDVGLISTITFKGVPPASIEFHDRNAVGDISAKKREAMKDVMAVIDAMKLMRGGELDWL